MGLNASTSHDATKFFMSLPANKLEMWFALEAERFQVCLCASVKRGLRGTLLFPCSPCPHTLYLYTALLLFMPQDRTGQLVQKLMG